MRDGGACVFIAEDQEYVDKILPIADRLPDLRAIVVLDDSAMFGYAHEKLHRFADLLAAAEKPDLAGSKRNWQGFRRPTRLSSSTLRARPAIRRARWSAMASILPPPTPSSTHYPTLREKPHRTVVYLPMCHVLGRDVAITLPLMSQLVPHFGEDPEDFAATLFEVAPTVMFTVPRYLQKFASHVAGRRAQFQPHQARGLRACDAVCAQVCAPPLGWHGVRPA